MSRVYEVKRCDMRENGPDTEQCAHNAVVAPTLKMWAKGFDRTRHSPVTATLGLGLCTKHAQTATIADFVTDKGWEQIVNTFKTVGKAEPCRESLEMEMVPVAQAQATMRDFEQRGRKT